MAFGKAKILAGAAALAVLAPMAAAFAINADVGADVNFMSTITLTPSNMQFGMIAFGATPGAGDTVTLKTDSTVQYGGTFTSGGSSLPRSAGSVLISATPGNSVDVSCTQTAVMAQNSGAGRITVNTIKVADEAAAAGGGTPCAGLGTPVLTFTLATTTDDEVKLGGIIDGSTQVSFAAGDYSSAYSGGSDIQVDIAYH